MLRRAAMHIEEHGPVTLLDGDTLTFDPLGWTIVTESWRVELAAKARLFDALPRRVQRWAIRRYHKQIGDR